MPFELHDHTLDLSISRKNERKSRAVKVCPSMSRKKVSTTYSEMLSQLHSLLAVRPHHQRLMLAISMQSPISSCFLSPPDLALTRHRSYGSHYFRLLTQRLSHRALSKACAILKLVSLTSPSPVERVVLPKTLPKKRNSHSESHKNDHSCLSDVASTGAPSVSTRDFKFSALAYFLSYSNCNSDGIQGGSLPPMSQVIYPSYKHSS